MEIKEVYIGSRKIRPTTPVYPLESIVTRQKADSAWQMYIPYWDTNWKVTIDDTVVQNWWSSYAFWWYTADTEHIVKIEPITLNYWRAKNYQWNKRTATIRNTVIEIIQDKSYIWFANSATATWNSFRSYEYNGCSNLINAAEEYLPDTVTTIGTQFRYNQYYGCPSITEAPVEVLPDTVTSIWGYFRADQYYNNTSLTSIKWWKDLDLGAISSYRAYQFYGCSAQKTVKVLSDVWPAGASTTLNNTYVTEIQVPTAYLSNFTSSTKQPRSSITDSKFVWY